MRKQNSNILAFFIISVLLSGCGIKGPLTQKPVEDKTQKQINSAETEQETNSSTKQSQEN